jgi:hypothetical protein
MLVTYIAICMEKALPLRTQRIGRGVLYVKDILPHGRVKQIAGFDQRRLLSVIRVLDVRVACAVLRVQVLHTVRSYPVRAAMGGRPLKQSAVRLRNGRNVSENIDPLEDQRRYFPNH